MKFGLPVVLCLLTGLVIAPARAQDMVEDGFPTLHLGRVPYAEDLEPEKSLYRDPPQSLELGAIAMSKLVRTLQPDGYRVRMVAIATQRVESSALLGDSDFAVEIRADWHGRYTIATAELPVPATWFRELALARHVDMPPRYRPVYEDPKDNDEAKKIAQEIIDRTQEKGPAEPCEIPIKDTLGKRILDAWKTMLARTHYSKQSETVVRGPEKLRGYEFEFHFHDDDREGVAPTLADGSRPDLLVSTGLAMRDYCKTKDEKYLTLLATKLVALEKRLPELKKAAQTRRKS